MATRNRADASVPAVRMLASYRARWLPKDVVAGLVLATLLVPQGMAYAELAGLPAITGLYTSILCLIGYAIFGPSRILVLGPDSSLGPMIAATILPLLVANGDPARAIALASMLALLVGAIMVLGGLARLGFIADLLSKPTMIGYMNGLALTILVSQLPKLFGFSVDADGFIDEAKGFVNGVARRGDRDGCTRHRPLRAGHDRRPAAGAAEGSCGSRRRRPVDPCGQPPWSRRPRGEPRRHASSGISALHLARRKPVGPAASHRRRARESRWSRSRTRSRPPRHLRSGPAGSSTATRK